MTEYVRQHAVQPACERPEEVENVVDGAGEAPSSVKEWRRQGGRAYDYQLLVGGKHAHVFQS